MGNYKKIILIQGKIMGHKQRLCPLFLGYVEGSLWTLRPA